MIELQLIDSGFKKLDNNYYLERSGITYLVRKISGIYYLTISCYSSVTTLRVDRFEWDNDFLTMKDDQNISKCRIDLRS